LGTAEAPADDAVVVTPVLPAALSLGTAPCAVFEARECPGATAETSAAIPALRAAVATIAQRRTRRTRSRAASRICAARDRSEPGLI
jgi:hypothetical protein